MAMTSSMLSWAISRPSRTGLGLVVDQGQHIHAEGGLQGGLGIEPVQHHLGIGVLFQFNDHPHAVAVGLVAQVGDALQPLVLDLLGDVLHQGLLVDLVGQLVDDDADAVVAEFLEFRVAADGDAAPAGGIGGADAAAAQDDALRGEIRALDVLHEVGQGGLRVVQDADAGVDDLPQVVGRDVGGHADGDARRAVDQQVGQPGGEHPGLLAALVEVRVPVRDLLVDVAEHLARELRHSGLGVAVGRGGIAVHGAEVAVALHQRVAHGEVLGHAHHGVVDRRVAVGMVAAQHVAHAGGGLLEGLVGGQAVLIQGIEDAPVHGL